MSGLPGVNIISAAGTLASVAVGGGKPLVVGPTSSGTANNTYTEATPQGINSDLGYGPAATLAQLIIADNGGSVDIVKATASIAATTTAVTSGSAMPTITVAGTPNDTYQFQLNITTAGALGTAYFQYTLDGINFSPSIVLNGTNVLANTGLTVTAATGSYPLLGTANFTTQAASMNSTDITNALNAYTGSANVPILLGVANDTTSAVSGSAIFTAVDSFLTTYRNTFKKPVAAILPTGGLAVIGQQATTAAAFASTISTLGNSIHVDAEKMRVQVPIPFNGWATPLVPFSYLVMDTSVGAQPISTSPALGTNNLPRAIAGSQTYDEFVNGNVYTTANIGAPRTFPNQAGVYLNQAALLSPAGSGYTYLQWGRVINLVYQLCQTQLQKLVNSTVRTVVNGNLAGAIDPRDAKTIMSAMNAILQSNVIQPGLATAVLFSVDQTYTGVLSNSTLQSQCVVVPLANISTVNETLSFSTAINAT